MLLISCSNHTYVFLFSLHFLKEMILVENANNNNNNSYFDDFDLEMAKEIYPHVLEKHTDLSEKDTEELLRMHDFYQGRN